MANAAGWQPDPDDADQERYWSGADWTDEVRPSVSARSLGGTGATGEPGAHGEPDHLPQLHRALSAAMSDLDAMDDRISTLFDRSDDGMSVRTAPMAEVPVATETGKTVAPMATEVAAGAAPDDDDIIDLFGEGDVAWGDDDTHVGGDADSRDGDSNDGVVAADRMAIISQYEDDIGGAFSDLDAELAAETPDEPGKAKRRKFGRHAKGTASAKRSS